MVKWGMHELAICRALLEEVERVARDHQADCIKAIVVKVGPLAGVEPALLRSAYPLVSAGTVAADAALVFEISRVRIRCLECEADSQVEANELACPQCGAWRTQVLEGDELTLTSVELVREKEIASHV